MFRVHLRLGAPSVVGRGNYRRQLAGYGARKSNQYAMRLAGLPEAIVTSGWEPVESEGVCLHMQQSYDTDRCGHWRQEDGR